MIIQYICKRNHPRIMSWGGFKFGILELIYVIKVIKQNEGIFMKEVEYI